MKKKFSVKNLLLISLAVFLVGLLIASLVSTNNGKTEMRRLSVMTDRGVSISLQVYKPVGGYKKDSCSGSHAHPWRKRQC